jgi:pyochelin biosynthetic protein PchC
LFAAWADLLPADVEVVAVQYPGREDRVDDEPVHDMASLSSAISSAILTTDAPVALFGPAMGAVVAFEVAARLEPGGDLVALFVSDAPAPHVLDPSSIGRLAAPSPTDGPSASAPEAMIRADRALMTGYAGPGAARLACAVIAFHAANQTEITLDEVRSWAELTSGPFVVRLVRSGQVDVEDDAATMIDHIVDHLRGRR